MKALALALWMLAIPTWAQSGTARAGDQNAAPSNAPSAQAGATTTQNPPAQQREKKRVTREESLPASAEHKGAWDFAVWGGGGHRITGGFRNQQITVPSLPTFSVERDIVGDVSVANVGFRIGKILTAEHGGGWYRGNFEYAVDLIPAYVFFGLQQRIRITSPLPCPVSAGGGGLAVVPCPPLDSPRQTAYGGGFNPLVLKWNFTGARRVSPYFELNGGVLFTNKEVPIGTSDVNFVSGATIGANIFTSLHHAISLDFRYAHISNAGLATPNPGINTLQGQIGFHWFK